MDLRNISINRKDLRIMVKAVFADFYGTLVYEDGEIIEKISQEIYHTGKAEDKSQIGAYWWKEFQTAFLGSYGENFQTQRKLEYQSLKKMIEYFKSSANAERLSNIMFEHWTAPPIFEDTKEFFERVNLPIYIVSNIVITQ